MAEERSGGAATIDAALAAVPPETMHRLLVRQLRAAARESDDGRPDLAVLLQLVSQAYAEQEELRIHDNQSIELVSREVAELNSRLREEANALRLARDEAEAANRAKSEFLAAMSHEIRTPMNGVLGMAAALEATPMSASQREMLGVINESGQILMTLLSDILDLSKIEAGRMTFERTPFNPAASVLAVSRLFTETAAAKGLTYTVEVEEAAQGWFLGDPTRFRQVLQNLVSNALKFTSEGGVIIRADVGAPVEGVATLQVEVVDTGLGVAAEACQRLFQAFTQADASTTRRFGGTGLGLAICRQLVEAMDGEIGVDSTPGQGSRFWFTLPVPQAETPQPAREPLREALPAGGRPAKLLVAEDNKNNQRVLQALLASAEVEMVFVDDGAAAVAAARDRDFDAILMDVEMPIMDGLTASRAIRALGGARGAVAIIAVSAGALPEQVAGCLDAGMDLHVSKPLRPESLFDALDQAFSLGRARGSRTRQSHRRPG